MHVLLKIIIGILIFVSIFTIIFVPIWYLVINKNEHHLTTSSILSQSSIVSNEKLVIPTTPIMEPTTKPIIAPTTTPIMEQTRKPFIIPPIFINPPPFINPLPLIKPTTTITKLNQIINPTITIMKPTTLSNINNALIKNYKIISNNNYIYILTEDKILYKMNSDFNNSTSFSRINIYEDTKWNDFIINKNLGIGIKEDLSLWVCNNNMNSMYKISNDKWEYINIDIDKNNNMYIIYGIKTDGSLHKWSYLYNFDLTILPVINNISSDIEWKSIYQDATNNKTFGILRTGELYAWGNNDNGSLGIPIKTRTDNPIYENTIMNPILISSDKWKMIVVLNNIIFGIKEDSFLYTWVYLETEESVNDIAMINYSFNVTLVNNIKYKDIQIINLNYSPLDTSKIYVIANSIDGDLWTMGYNNKGMLGTSIIDNINLLTLTNNNTGNWKKILSFNGIFYGIKEDSSLWSWGRYNVFNKFALFDQPDSAIIIRNETQIGNLKWKDIFINPIYSTSFNTFYYLGITEDNKLYGWGLNNANILNLTQLDFNNNTIDYLGQTYYAVKEPILIDLPNL